MQRRNTGVQYSAIQCSSAVKQYCNSVLHISVLVYYILHIKYSTVVELYRNTVVQHSVVLQ